MNRIIQDKIENLFKSLNLHIEYFPKHDIRRRMSLLKHYDIKTILDVGANIGQFAMEMRELGFKGKIISFEPLADAYKELEKNTQPDKNWTAYNCALGSINGQTLINVASNLQSSSMLPMLKEHQLGAPTVHFTKTETIEIKTLSSIWASDIQQESLNFYLKIDTQGFEKEVLRGAEDVLHLIKGVQLEMALIPLYEGEWLYNEISDYLKSKNFILHSVEPHFEDKKTGQLLQMDGIFYRQD